MRSSPFSSPAVIARIFAKAAALLLIGNVAFLALRIDPLARLMTLNTWGLVGRGRARLFYPSDSQNGQLPVEALLAAHQIAYAPKAADEFRVIILGDSGTLGWTVPDDAIISAQLTAQNVQIGGKHVVAYDLAYPVPNVARDALILDAALRYQPDLVIWFVTAEGFRNTPEPGQDSTFLDINRVRLQRLTDAYDLQDWFNARLEPEPAWRSWLAIRNPDAASVWFNSLYYPFAVPSWGQTTRRLGSEAIPAKPRFASDNPAFRPMPNETWQFLLVGQSLAGRAGASLLLVNEPILVGSGPNSDVNYNLLYERALYDSYRQTLTDYAGQHKIWFRDLWNAIPAPLFTDTAFHLDAQGWALVAENLALEVRKFEEKHVE